MGLYPRPTPAEYIVMAKAVRDKYTNLQYVNPKYGEYWLKFN